MCNVRLKRICSFIRERSNNTIKNELAINTKKVNVSKTEIKLTTIFFAELSYIHPFIHFMFQFVIISEIHLQDFNDHVLKLFLTDDYKNGFLIDKKK